MSDPSRPPVRLSEQSISSPLTQALLRAGKDVGASKSTQAGVLEALGLEGQSVRSVRTRFLPFGRTSLLLAAMVISAVAVGIPLASRTLSSTPPEVQQDETQRDETQRDDQQRGREQQESANGLPNAAPEAPKIEAQAAPKAELAPLQPSTTKIARSNDETSVARASATVRNALGAELAALDAARAKLNGGEAKAAWSLLDAYHREFPKPRLALEAEVLRIDALDRMGQTEAAKKRAAAFVRSHPKGVLTGRVRRYLEK